MFTENLPPELFKIQREFIRVMGGKTDFIWAARTLVKEETKELEKAYEKMEISDENLKDIFKELGDVVYVAAYFYNVMPQFANELVNEEVNEELIGIMDNAAKIVSKVSMKLQIPVQLVLLIFEKIHLSNMSKLDNDGKPIRRKDGKIMKGPNYVPPDMGPIIEEWKKLQLNIQKVGETK